jgi:hypothetical protein
VVDDILDVTADSHTLGKTAGKDAAQDKPTFVSLMGLRQSQNYAQELLSQAQVSLRHSGLSETPGVAGPGRQVGQSRFLSAALDISRSTACTPCLNPSTARPMCAAARADLPELAQSCVPTCSRAWRAPAAT